MIEETIFAASNSSPRQRGADRCLTRCRLLEKTRKSKQLEIFVEKSGKAILHLPARRAGADVELEAPQILGLIAVLESTLEQLDAMRARSAK
jgi:hypothetical protein